ncbi:MAG: hypothetical protein DYG89_40220 [Caldilinea sp. CFX5]|nr:hypothetical protein [Caldilinea sp. CFX5]
MTTAKPETNPPTVGVDTTHVTAAHRAPSETNRALISNPGARATAPAVHNNLTLPRTALIGRDHDVAAIQHLLLQEQVGLLTLTGPGGIGKTRLALQVAANLLDHFVDGVYFVSLAPISDPDLVASAIAQTLGVREVPGRAMQESLQEYLRDKQLLLVLDNFEQILPAAPLVSALLAACPRLKVLVTSRASLHLYSEQEFPVAPLALPDAKQLTTGSQSEYAAIDLFCQRAKAVKPDFALTPENATAVAQICIALDGLPLALELAAARIKLFAPAALLARLNQRLTLLTGGSHDLPTRQRTLRDEIAWSYDLLTPDEQTLFRRLAVFVGGFTLEAAQAVSSADGDRKIDTLAGVASLLGKNLVRQVEAAGDARFSMLETIHEYALEQLIHSVEAEMLRRDHACFFLALAEATEADLLGPRRQPGLTRLNAELDNLRAIFAWSATAEDRSEIGVRLAGALAWFAHFGNHVSEVRGWLVTTLQRATEPTAARAKALWGAGLLAAMHGNFPIARSELEESTAHWRKIGDLHGLAIALRELCMVAYCQSDFVTAQRYGKESVALCRVLDSRWDLALALDNLASAVAGQGDRATARTLFEEELVLFQALDDTWGIASAFSGLGFIAGLQGDNATARAHFTQALVLQRAAAHKWLIAEALTLLGEIRQRQGEMEEADALYRESLLLGRELGDKGGMGLIFHHLGTLAQGQRQPERAVRLLAVAAILRHVTGGASYHTLTTLADQEHAIATVRALVGEERFAACWVEGQALSMEQAIEYALAIPKASAGAVPANTESAVESTHPLSTASLTAREIEVLRLLVQGLPYAEIADKLVISRRTVNAHVTSIFSKLGVTSRAAATRIAIDHGLG